MTRYLPFISLMMLLFLGVGTANSFVVQDGRTALSYNNYARDGTPFRLRLPPLPLQAFQYLFRRRAPILPFLPSIVLLRMPLTTRLLPNICCRNCRIFWKSIWQVWHIWTSKFLTVTLWSLHFLKKSGHLGISTQMRIFSNLWVLIRAAVYGCLNFRELPLEWQSCIWIICCRQKILIKLYKAEF